MSTNEGQHKRAYPSEVLQTLGRAFREVGEQRDLEEYRSIGDDLFEEAKNAAEKPPGASPEEDGQPQHKERSALSGNEQQGD